MQPELAAHKQVDGLLILQNFISKQQQKELIDSIKKQKWNTSLKRRTQHYGYQYSYDRKSTATKTTQLPQWCLPIKQKIEQRIYQHMQIQNNPLTQSPKFDQMIVNEYQPGQGINPHIDNITLFQDIVVSVSLGSNTVMVFQKGEVKVEVELKRCSVIVLTGDARYGWKHGIPSRKSDYGAQRGVRYSLTFRRMIL